MPHTASTQTIGGVYTHQAEGSAEKRRQKQRGLKDVCCALKKSGTQAQWLTGSADRRQETGRKTSEAQLAGIHGVRACSACGCSPEEGSFIPWRPLPEWQRTRRPS